MLPPALNQLDELQPHSGKTIDPRILARIQDTQLPKKLVKNIQISNANWAVKPRNGLVGISRPENIQSIRRVKTLTRGEEGNLTYALNSSLLGGTSYPILTTALGIASGFVSAGGSILFSVATTAISLGTQVQRVLARTGDEIWHIEEIGKVKDGHGYRAEYVSAFLIVDPYRFQTSAQGWLIHEERKNVVFED